MIKLGQMVRAGTSTVMKVVDIHNDIADCIWIDGNGNIRHRHHDLDGLSPFWLSLSPKTIWPEGGNLDLVALEKEQRSVAAQRKASREASRRASRKARRSNKLARA